MKIIVANWKMHRHLNEARQFITKLQSLNPHELSCRVILAPSAPFIGFIQGQNQTHSFSLAAQSCHEQEEGAYTGDISPHLLAEMGCVYCLVGHSEQRKYHAEVKDTLHQKMKAVIRNKMVPILCIGESIEDYQKGVTEDVLSRELQSLLKNIPPQYLLIAYEPLWAIGSGITPTMTDIDKTLQFIRHKMDLLGFTQVSILYGGSVSERNSHDILALPHVDGVLVGKASLNFESFLKICKSAH
jgi:triosephosphate isomerase (TIM)